MSANERMVTFINSMEEDLPPLLGEIEREALSDEVPIIRKDMQGFMRFLIKTKKPLRILEVGTATGFSALLMAEYMPAGAKITTIEKYEKRIPVAKKNFERAGKSDAITLLEGDATEILPALTEGYDFIFMDAAKGQYLNFLPEAVRLLTPGGTLLTDNVLQDGDIIESRYGVCRRNRTIHARMREYLYELKHHPLLDTVVLTVGDGAAVSVKKENDYEET